MKNYPILFFILFSTAISAKEIGGDFWMNCPGPACPANAPVSDGATQMDAVKGLSDREDDKSLKKMDAPELNKRKLKLEQELKAIKAEKQRREATP